MNSSNNSTPAAWDLRRIGLDVSQCNDTRVLSSYQTPFRALYAGDYPRMLGNN